MNPKPRLAILFFAFSALLILGSMMLLNIGSEPSPVSVIAAVISAVLGIIAWYGRVPLIGDSANQWVREHATALVVSAGVSVPGQVIILPMIGAAVSLPLIAVAGGVILVVMLVKT